jgi:hypothetical protein
MGLVLLLRHLKEITQETLGQENIKEEYQMSKVAANKVKTQTGVETSVPQLRLPDSESMAEIIMTQAMQFCAQKMGLAGHQAVVERLQGGDGSACKYCHYSIAKQVAESLGAMDGKIKAVYIADYDATPQDLCFGAGMPELLIHLIIWAERKTKALDSLVGALDRALIQRYADTVGVRPLAHLLDIQVVDDHDVENRIGYGAMLSSLHNRPIQIWRR